MNVASPITAEPPATLAAPKANKTLWAWRHFIYLATGMPLFAIVTLIIIIGLLLAAATLPLALLGIVVLFMTLALANLICKTERARIKILIGTEIPYSPTSNELFQGSWRQRLRYFGTTQPWQEVAAITALLLVHMIAFIFLVASWGFGLFFTSLPIYYAAGGTISLGEKPLNSLPLLIISGIIGVVFLFLCPKITRLIAIPVLKVSTKLLGPSPRREMTERIKKLSSSRDAALNTAENERRRIERNLHDGAQQRLIALTMDLARAKARLSKKDSSGAGELISQAQQQAQTALTELRHLVRGMHPPVLSERGLDAALSGLAALSPTPVTLDIDIKDRLPETVESAAYFTVAEALTNVAKHAQASSVTITARYNAQTLWVTIVDNGQGGADITGNGLAGLNERITAVDGRLNLHSPAGGPTSLTVELPCG